MDKRILFALLALLFILPLFSAQTTLVAKPITRIHLVGNGIAVNDANAMDFMHAKAVIGAVRLKPEEDSNATLKRLGVLILDNTVYHLKNIAVTLEEVSADVYAKDSNTAIGRLYVARYEKPGRDIWAGELSLNSALYNVYFLALRRQFKPLEAAEKISEYCEENPDDERCNTIVAQCAENPRACKARVVNYCKENPEDAICTALQKLYCLRNASDVRCTDFLKEQCKENPAQIFCRIKKVRDQDVIAINPEEVESETVEEDEETADTTGTGAFVLLISDAEADINNFQTLNVTFESARIFQTGTGFETVDLNGVTVDLTTVVGEKAIPIVEIELQAGKYTKIELNVQSTNAILLDGNAATVTVPSDKLKIIKPFEIDANSETKFVFDIQVVRKGQTNEYNLLPVVGKSGVIGEDIDSAEIEEVESEEEESGED